MGAKWIYITGHALLIARTLDYALIESGVNANLKIFAADSVKGLSSALLSSSIVRIASDMSANNIVSTSQSIFYLAFYGLPAFLASATIDLRMPQVLFMPFLANNLENIKMVYSVSIGLGIIILIFLANIGRILPRNSGQKSSSVDA